MKKFSVRAYDKNDILIYQCDVIAQDEEQAYDAAYDKAVDEEDVHLDFCKTFIDEEQDLGGEPSKEYIKAFDGMLERLTR